VLPIVTPVEMRVVDAAASESVATLIERAGLAVTIAAARTMGGTYGKRVVVLAGTGNNGADGRVAGRRLAERGARVTVLETSAMPAVVPECDLVIDAAYGTGFHGEWSPPEVGDTPVLAVDIPSGVDGLTGRCGPGVLAAQRTVTFAALKPGLLVAPGSAYTGVLEVADIGLDVSATRTHLVQHDDVARWVPRREVDAHKWRSAVWVIAGSTGMAGAARLAAGAAMRAGAGMVYLSSPGTGVDPSMPTEVVGRVLPHTGWSEQVLGDSARFHAFVVGPGMGREESTATEIRRFVAGTVRPVVVDGDGLFALAWSDDGAAPLLRSRPGPTVLTPHDGEYALLVGERVGDDRIASARFLAARTGCVVLLKGSATVVAEPTGRVLVVAAGDERLATAGTGDVLSGIIGALLASDVPPFEAAAAGAWIHGQAARRGPSRGLIAGDLVDLIPSVLEAL
jgi:NAD(P)H-hydrate epimerase